MVVYYYFLLFCSLKLKIQALELWIPRHWFFFNLCVILCFERYIIYIVNVKNTLKYEIVDISHI